MRPIILALCLTLAAFPATAQSEKLETPKLEEFPQWSDRFARCTALYSTLGDDMERKAAPDDSTAMAKVKAYRALEKQAGYAAGTYARKAMVGISPGMVEQVFQDNRIYFNGEINANDENGVANIKAAAAECKKILPIQQAIEQGARRDAKKRIAVKREGTATY